MFTSLLLPSSVLMKGPGRIFGLTNPDARLTATTRVIGGTHAREDASVLYARRGRRGREHWTAQIGRCADAEPLVSNAEANSDFAAGTVASGPATPPIHGSVLIVEDDTTVAFAIARVLRWAQFAVEIVGDGPSALASATSS